MRPDRAPLDWATTQNNLGNVLSRLGERERDPSRLERELDECESGTAHLEQAVEAYQAALQQRITNADWRGRVQRKLERTLALLEARRAN